MRPFRKSELTDDAFGPSLTSPGADWLDKAWEAKTPAARRKAARKALAIDLDCLDAYVVLALEAESDAEKIALLREAVRIGDRLFAPVLDQDEMHWWGFIGTRPFMRAQQNLGLALSDVGDYEEAEAVYRRLLALNPNDNQGIRTLIVEILMTDDRLDDLRDLLNQYPDDFQIEMAMASLFVEMRDGKPTTVLNRRADAINERNPFVLAQLAGLGSPESKIEFSPYGIAVGSEQEAFEYAERSGRAWQQREALMNAIKRYVVKRAG